MVKVKICGLKTLADIDIVNQVRPDYIGLVFTTSRRQLDVATARSLVSDLNPDIKTVGVFANSDRAKIEDIANQCGLDILQFHGQESPVVCNSFQQEVWKAIPVKDEQSLTVTNNYSVAGILLDTYHPRYLGGTGQSFNWDLVTKISQTQFTILAGGLTKENVLEAIATVKPAVVDVSSGVEIDGTKNYQAVNEFVAKVRSVI